MRAHDLRARFKALHGQGDRSAEPFAHRRFIGQGSDHPLSARSKQKRTAQRVEHRKPIDQREAVGQRLAKTKAGVDNNFIAGDPRRRDML